MLEKRRHYAVGGRGWECYCAAQDSKQPRRVYMNVLSRSCRSCAWRYGRARRLSGHRGSSRHLAAGHVRSSAGSSAAYCLDLVRLVTAHFAFIVRGPGMCLTFDPSNAPEPWHVFSCCILLIVISLRRYDHEHYLCCLLLPRDSRSTSIALRALNIELAQVPCHISQSTVCMCVCVCIALYICGGAHLHVHENGN